MSVTWRHAFLTASEKPVAIKGVAQVLGCCGTQLELDVPQVRHI